MSALKYFVDLPKRRYRLCCPLTYLFSGYPERFSLGQKPPNLVADLCGLVSRSRMNGSEHRPPCALIVCTGNGFTCRGSQRNAPLQRVEQRRWMLEMFMEAVTLSLLITKLQSFILIPYRLILIQIVPLHLCYMFRPVLGPSSGMSIQKSYKV
jgi:hypothetical protein